MPLEVLWQDGERAFCRTSRRLPGADRSTVLVVVPSNEDPASVCADRLAHEYDLRADLDASWAVQPLALVRERGRTVLVLDDPGGELLCRFIGKPMDLGSFLHLATGVAAAVGQLHRHGLIHKDIKPANVLVNTANGAARLTGFGIASRLTREKRPAEPPEFIAGTLPFMAPEQTGRMNRSIDSRSDLYSLGVTFYQMLTGVLPFAASDPMEWVHCHIARAPVPPRERLATIPAAISQLVMKLLAKTAEERYQTAAGVEHDLRRCRTEWEMRARIDDFPLGANDVPDRLMIPEKLYGRSREVAALLDTFHRVVATGTPELVLVSGYSGIGKSSVVHELHKVLVPPRGLFASGKFDQYKRDIPYATLAQAFQGLVRQILSKSEAELHVWRDELREALGSNGQLIVDLIPDLELVIGKQQAVPYLPPQDAQRRFQTALRRFIGVFARPEHPLALFLDDLQWLDAATLDLLENILTQPDIRHLLLIGAYRDNEVDAAHPLVHKLDVIRRVGAKVRDIVLAPLSHDELGQLVADSLRCDSERASPLAQLVYEKTGGNPFFGIQFLSSLAEEGLLGFDHTDAQWSWDVDRIHSKQYTDNVVDLMVLKLNRLPAETQDVVRQLACVGSGSEFSLLAIVCEKSQQDLHAALWEAVRSGLVLRSETSYAFQHDRIQEAAYSLIPEAARAAAHLRIGRLMTAHIPAEKREDAVFEIVGQLNRGAALITGQEERDQLAELNVIAGQRAKASTAYASALAYLAAGAALMAEDAWERRHDLAFALEWRRAECEFLTGALAEATERLTMLSSRAAGTVEHAIVACLRIDLFTALNQPDRAIAVCLDYLRRLGVEWSPHPTKADVQAEYRRIWSQIGSRTIEDLIDLPLMENPESRATLDVLTATVTPALWTDPNLLSLITCGAVNLSLEHGNSDGSSFTYAWLGVLAGAIFDDYAAGFRFGQLGLELVDKRGLKRFRARACLIFGNLIVPWTKHVRAGRDLLRAAFEAANETGDLTFATYSRDQLNTNLLAAGDPLEEVQREVEFGLDFARKARLETIVGVITAQLCLVRTLRGSTREFGSFDDGEFVELQFERDLASEQMALPACRYWIAKLQARFFSGRLRCGARCVSPGAGAALDVDVDIRNGGIPFLQRPQPRRILSVRAPRPEPTAYRGPASSPRAACNMGRELPGEFREPRGAGRRRDCPSGGPRPRCPASLRTGHPLGPGKRLCPE